jgi:hypothetical protein
MSKATLYCRVFDSGGHVINSQEYDITDILGADLENLKNNYRRSATDLPGAYEISFQIESLQDVDTSALRRRG